MLFKLSSVILWHVCVCLYIWRKSLPIKVVITWCNIVIYEPAHTECIAVKVVSTFKPKFYSSFERGWNNMFSDNFLCLPSICLIFLPTCDIPSYIRNKAVLLMDGRLSKNIFLNIFLVQIFVK